MENIEIKIKRISREIDIIREEKKEMKKEKSFEDIKRYDQEGNDEAGSPSSEYWFAMGINKGIEIAITTLDIKEQKLMDEIMKF